MSAPESEFEVLLRGFANRELSPEETERLRALASEEPERAAQIDEIEAVHEMLAAEASLRGEVVADESAASPAEDGAGTPEMARLHDAAMRSEDDIRARYSAAAASAAGGAYGSASAQRWRAIGLAIGAAAVLVFGFAFLFGEDGMFPLGDASRPELQNGAPGDETLGGERVIPLDGKLVGDPPRWTWSAVEGAVRYDVSLHRVDGSVLLQRAVAQSRDTAWQLDADQQTFVGRELRQRLWLRVQALDADGNVLARGDVEASSGG